MLSTNDHHAILAKVSVIALFIVLVAAVGCDRPKVKPTHTPPKPASFRETLFMSVTPTADGGAYAAGFDSGLWYLRGSEAVKVQFPDMPTNSPDTFFIGLEITPLLNGDAYAHSMIENSFWHLHEGTAKRVTEVSSLSTARVSGPVSAFPLYVAERQRRLQAELKLEERPDPEDGPLDEEY